MRRKSAHLGWAGWVAVVLAATVLQTPESASAGEEASEGAWILEPSAAAERIEEENPTVLDTRSKSAWKEGHVPGAVRFDWEQFTPSAQPKRGKLTEDDAQLGEKLRELGVSSGRPVVVVGASDGGWGEAGRAVWMLRTLGHDAAAWVDGGYEALVAEGVEETTDASEPSEGDFRVERRERWSISKKELRSSYRDDDVVLLDTREPREYRGETPYGESRGGHIPGAEHLYFKDLLNSEGRLVSPTRIRARLEALGAEPDDTIVTYCTGGVRSAWVATVLIENGYSDVRNYAGSTWEWSAGSADEYPLETP